MSHRQTLKVLAVNLGAIFIIASLIEVIFGKWFFSWPFHQDVIDYKSCKNKLTYWSYCPGLTAINRMSPEDGSEWIYNHINMSKIRVKDRAQLNSLTDFSDYNVFITGDSFIQADEVSYDQTLGNKLAEKSGLSVLQNGYSSWAVIQYLNFFKTIRPKEGDIFIAFLNLTDLSPNNKNSNMYWRQKGHTHPDGQFLFDVDESRATLVKSAQELGLLDNSALVAMYNASKLRFNEITAKKKGPEQYASTSTWDQYTKVTAQVTKPFSSCSGIDQFDGISPAAMDYLIYNYPKDCWDQEHHASYNSAVKDLREISHYVNQHKARFIVVLFPMGWAFPGQGLISKQHPYYSFSAEAVVTTLGLYDHLLEDLRGVEIVEVESILQKFNSSQDNDLYFPVDGHWTPKAHQIIGHWLADYIES